MSESNMPAQVGSNDGLGLLPERADFEAWANVDGFGERDGNGKFWFYRNGGDGMWEAYCAGAGEQRARDARASRDYLNAMFKEGAPARTDLLAALQWYADGLHFDKASPDAWDTVSGEPQNWWCDEAGTATVEDGSIAAMTLRGELTAEQIQALD